MSKIENLEDHKPHIVVNALDGNPHIIPKAFFDSVSLCKLDITELENYEVIVPVIISQWLEAIDNEH